LLSATVCSLVPFLLLTFIAIVIANSSASSALKRLSRLHISN
jgi:hypothetical protein